MMDFILLFFYVRKDLDDMSQVYFILFLFHYCRELWGNTQKIDKIRLILCRKFTNFSFINFLLVDYLECLNSGGELEEQWLNVLHMNKLYKEEDDLFEVMSVFTINNSSLRSRYEDKRKQFQKKVVLFFLFIAVSLINLLCLQMCKECN